MRIASKSQCYCKLLVPSYMMTGARQGSDAAVAALVRLLIIDEVHLLNDERGPVIETLVARTQRQVPCLIRIGRLCQQ